MVNYVNILDKGLDCLLGSLHSHRKLRDTITRLFNEEVTSSFSWADDTDITNLDVFTLKNGTIDIVTMVELGNIYIYIYQ